MSAVVVGASCGRARDPSPGVPPNAPTNLVATAVGGGKVELVWSAPVSGPAPTGYRISSNPGAVALDTMSTSASLSSGLLVGVSYSFNVQSTNEAGAGVIATSAVVTVGDVPGAPTNLSVGKQGRRATVSWNAPSSDNGSPIVTYTVTSSPPGFMATVAPAPRMFAIFDAVPTNASYSFSVTATNAFGEGAAASFDAGIFSCTNEIRTIVGTDSVSVQYGTVGEIANDDSVVAYRLDKLPYADFDVTGWVKFDLSPIPPGAQVNAMTLSLEAQSVNQGSRPPTIEVWYSIGTSWHRQDAPGPSAIPRTQAVSTAVMSSMAPLPRTDSFPIDTSARNFSIDVTNRTLTLGVQSTVDGGYNLYFGTDPPAAQQPILQITTCE